MRQHVALSQIFPRDVLMKVIDAGAFTGARFLF